MFPVPLIWSGRVAAEPGARQILLSVPVWGVKKDRELLPAMLCLKRLALSATDSFFVQFLLNGDPYLPPLQALALQNLSWPLDLELYVHRGQELRVEAFSDVPGAVLTYWLYAELLPEETPTPRQLLQTRLVTLSAADGEVSLVEFWPGPEEFLCLNALGFPRRDDLWLFVNRDRERLHPTAGIYAGAGRDVPYPHHVAYIAAPGQKLEITAVTTSATAITIPVWASALALPQGLAARYGLRVGEAAES